MIAHPLSARRVLVVAPHPDDEAIGAYGLMRRLGRAGARIDVLVVSDGGASHPESRQWPRVRLARERRRETQRAMRSLAIPPSRIRFLGLPDGRLEADAALLGSRLARAMSRRAVPDLVVGPVAEDAHADHRAVAQVLARLPRRGARRLGYRVWPQGSTRPRHGFVLPLDDLALRAKRRAIRSYRTQNGSITDAQAGFAITLRQLRAFTRPREQFAVLA